MNDRLQAALLAWSNWYSNKVEQINARRVPGPQIFGVEDDLYEALPLNCKRFIDPFIVKKKQRKKKENGSVSRNNTRNKAGR